MSGKTFRIYVSKRKKCDRKVREDETAEDAMLAARWRYPSVMRSENVTAKLIRVRVSAIALDGTHYNGPFRDSQNDAEAAWKEMMCDKFPNVADPFPHVNIWQWTLEK